MILSNIGWLQHNFPVRRTINFIPYSIASYTKKALDSYVLQYNAIKARGYYPPPSPSDLYLHAFLQRQQFSINFLSLPNPIPEKTHWRNIKTKRNMKKNGANK